MTSDTPNSKSHHQGTSN